MEVQINSLAGLESVMGQDTSFDLKIKRSVWNEYAREHVVEELKGEHGRGRLRNS